MAPATANASRVRWPETIQPVHSLPSGAPKLNEKVAGRKTIPNATAARGEAAQPVRDAAQRRRADVPVGRNEARGIHRPKRDDVRSETMPEARR